MTGKMNINFYLDYPKHSYYDILIRPDKDTPNGIITSIFQRLYPPHLHSYSTTTPEFIYVREGTVLDPDKTFAENGITYAVFAKDGTPDVRIRLKIHILLKSKQHEMEKTKVN